MAHDDDDDEIVNLALEMSTRLHHLERSGRAGQSRAEQALHLVALENTVVKFK